MIGEKVQEVTGKVTSNRVIPAEHGIKVETSYQASGRLLGVETSELGSYTAQMRPSGVLYGTGQGLLVSKDGDHAQWTGHGIGKPTGKGMAASYRYSLVIQSTSPKWARLNGVVIVGEWEVDENGNTKGQGWEWK
jgi:hypothetical protein